MSYIEEYKKWLSSPAISDDERAELERVKDDDKAIKDRFFAPLEFGTAGLRGVMGPGINRMNLHVVRQTTQAMANLVLSEGPEAVKKGVAVCFDCRHRSDEFAREAACVFAANGIPARLFESLRPTPELSFAIREYGCTAGINITASHNPKEYNGYKVYWSDGAQLPPAHAEVVAREMEKLDIFTGAKTMPYEDAVSRGLVTIMGAETDKEFLDMVMCQSVSQDSVKKVADTFKLVYTPFHGTGHELVPRALKKLGFKYVICVPEQMMIDGSFPTVKSPNPEEKAGFKLAIDLAKSVGATLIIGTDPDADRVGIVLRDNAGEYVTLSGNQVGVLLLDYLIKAKRENGTMPHNPAAIKTIVTTEMARRVGEANGVPVFDTFTGFKFMAEKIKEFEEKHSHRYIFAYEESYGYLAGDHCRDKDAVTASMLIAEMAAWYACKGMTLYDAMESLYKEYGCYGEQTLNLVMPGLEGMEKMKALMARLRSDPPENVSGTRVKAVRDYLRGERYDLATGAITRLEIKGSNVLYWELEDGTMFIVRPSGTEPKVKVYILAQGSDRADCDYRLGIYSAWAEDLRN